MPDIDSGAFFKPGGTLDPSAPSYIARAADERLLKALLAHEYVFLLDSRQKGKSSLVARTIVQLRKAGITTVKLDLQRIGANVTPEQWYAGLLAGVGQELDLTTEIFAYWGASQAVGPLARWVGAIVEVVLPSLERPIVVFVDEVDFVRALGFSTDEFFAAVRDCYNRRSDVPDLGKLTFCLVGVATPAQLIRNPEITPFNIGTRIDLSDFTLEELEGYAVVLDTATRDGPSILQRVHYWLNGHPYLTQLLCSRIAGSPEVLDAGGVDRLVHELFLSPEARQREPNFADVERRLLEPDIPGMGADERRTQVLGLYGRMLKGQKVEVSEENPVVGTVRLSGVGGEVHGELRVRNRVYETVFGEAWRQKNLPDAEARRLRAATRRAVLRTSLIAGIVVGVVLTAAIYSSIQSKLARRDRDAARYESYASSMLSASVLWDENSTEGIAAIVDHQAAYERKGWEWRYWKASSGAHLLADDDGQILDFRWTRDGKLILARHRTGIWWINPQTGRVVKRIETKTQDQSVVFELPNGNVLDLSWTGNLKVWSPAGRVVFGAKTPRWYWRPNSMLDPTGRYLLGKRSSPLWMFDLEKRKLMTLETHADRAVFGAGGRVVAALLGFEGRGKPGVALLDPGTLKIKKTFALNKQPSSVAIDPGGTFLAVGMNDGELRFLDIQTGMQLYTDSVGNAIVWRMDFSADGKGLSVGTLGAFCKIYRVEGRKGRPLGIVRGAKDAYWSPTSDQLLASMFRGRIIPLTEIEDLPLQVRGQVWRCIGEDGSVVSLENGIAYRYSAMNQGNQAESVSLPPGLNWEPLGVQMPDYAIGYNDHVSLVFGLPSLKLLARIPNNGGRLVSFCDLGDGRAIVANLWRSLSQWDAKTGVSKPLGLDDAPNVATPPSKSYVVVSGDVGSVTRWDPKTDERIKTFDFAPYTLHACAFSKDETWFAGAFDSGFLYMIDARTLKPLRTFAQHSGNAECVALSPDERRMASGSDDQTVRIWDVETGRMLTILRGHKATVVNVRFIDGGRTLVSLDISGRVMHWRTAE